MPRTTDAVTVGVELAPHLLRRLDAVAAALDMERTEAMRAAIARWLQEEERTAACRDRMMKVRATAGRDSRIA